MKRVLSISLLILVLAISGAVAFAQGGETAQPEAASSSGVEIVWPSPISEVWETIDIIGTASIPDFAFYRLEAIPLNNDLTIPDNVGWIPITVDLTEPVVNGVLATIDTATVPDGLYGLRLVVGTGSVDNPSQLFEAVTGPIRTNNGLYASGDGSETTPPPPPELAANDPYVVTAPGVTSVTLRRCDLLDSDRCPITGILDYTEGAALLGVSTTGSGWYLVETGSGLQGWVSPLVVMVVGDTSNVPQVVPPEPLPAQPGGPAMVQPPAQPQPPAPAPLATINGLAVIDQDPVCGRTFTVHVNVTNQGGTAPSAPGTVTLQNIHRGTGKVNYTGHENYPSIPPGGNYVVVFRVKMNRYHSQGQELRASTNGSNFATKYDIAQGNCKKASDSQGGSKTSEVDFAPGQCTVTPKTNAPTYSFPQGPRVGRIFEGSYNAIKGAQVNKRRWYMIETEPGTGNPPQWLRDKDLQNTSSGCNF